MLTDAVCVIHSCDRKWTVFCCISAIYEEVPSDFEDLAFIRYVHAAREKESERQDSEVLPLIPGDGRNLYAGLQSAVLVQLDMTTLADFRNKIPCILCSVNSRAV